MTSLTKSSVCTLENREGRADTWGHDLPGLQLALPSLGRNKRPAEDDLHPCFNCGKDYVNPVNWEPVTPEAWWMQLRCGECEVYREVTVTNKVAERFDVELDRAPT